MNIIDIQDNLKDLPDQALMAEMQRPSGSAPPFLIVGELRRRKRMREDYQRRQNANTPTVAQEAMTAVGVPQGGLPQMAKSMAPKSSIAQNTGMDKAMPVTPTQAPQPQMMADGGIMKLRRGRKLGRPVEYAGETYMVTDTGEVFLNNRRVQNRDLISAVLGERPEVMTKAPTLGSEALAGAQPDEATSISKIDFDATTPQAPIQQLTPEDLMTSSTAYYPNMLFKSPSIAGIDDDIYRQRAASEIAGTALRDLTVADEEAAKAREAGLAQFGEKRTEVEEAPRAIGTVGFGIDQLTERDRLLRQQGIDRRSKIEGDRSKEREDNLARMSSPDQIMGTPLDIILQKERQDYNAALADRDRQNVAANLAKSDAGGLPDVGNLNVPMGYLGSGNIAGPQYYLDEKGNVKSSDYSEGEYYGGGRNKLSGTSASRDANARMMIRDYFEDKEEYDKILGNEVGRSDAKREDSENEYMKLYDEYYQFDPQTGFQLTDEQVNEKFKSRFDGTADAPIRGAADLANEAAITASLAANQAGYEAAAYPEAPLSGPALIRKELYRGLKDASGKIYNFLTPEETRKERVDAQKRFDPFDSFTAPMELYPSTEPIEKENEAPFYSLDPEQNENLFPPRVLGVPDQIKDIPTSVKPSSDSDTGGDTDGDTGGDTGGGGIGGGIASGTDDGLRSRLAQMIEDRESDRESDKWMALAQTGLALMASKNPTLGGALGEAGLAGVGALKKSKAQYDKDMLSLLGIEEDMRKADLTYQASMARTKASKGGNKALNQAIDDARAYLNSLRAEARSLRKVNPADSVTETPASLTDLTTDKMKADIVAAQDRLDALMALRTGGGGTQFDATKN